MRLEIDLHDSKFFWKRLYNIIVQDYNLFLSAHVGANVVVEEVRDDQQVDDFRGHLDHSVVEDAMGVHKGEDKPKAQSQQSVERSKSDEISQRLANHFLALKHPQLRK